MSQKTPPSSAPSSFFQSIGVVGAGQMGSGIAQVCAASGYFVLLLDVNPTSLKNARIGIAKSLDRFVKKEEVTPLKRMKILESIVMTESYEALASVDLVIEAAPEDESLKIEVYQKLSEYLKPHAIIATNTSSLSITRLAAASDRPQKMIGVHFMNPVPMMPLVEIIRGMQTDDKIVEDMYGFIASLGKEIVESQDHPGFIINRLLMPMINEAIFTLFEGVGTVEDIDQALRLGASHQMGPLELADLIGLDTCLAIMKSLYNGFHDSKYRPCPLLVQYVDAGWLGRKTKRGFYDYSANQA